MKHFFTSKQCLVLVLFLCLAKLSSAQVPYIVKDIGKDFGNSFVNNLTSANGIVFFTAYDNNQHGEELWRSDGTAAGTYLVKDINPGGENSDIAEIVNVNGTVFFRATDAVNGIRLWKSDGTTSGTVMVSSDVLWPAYITSLNGVVYFSGNDSANGNELWKSDGTPEGTTLVKDINVGTGGSSINYMANINGTLYFSTNYNGTVQLWKSDGSTEGTELVKQFNSPYSDMRQFTNGNGTLFLIINDPVYGRELWKSDGTSEGTVMVKDINPGIDDSSISDMIFKDNMLYFTAVTNNYGRELWKSDGTEAGTKLVKDIYPGEESSGAYGFVNVNGIFYFSAEDGINGRELWKSDGTADGTELVKDIFPGSWGSFVTNIVNVNGTMYFAANSGSQAPELWKSDGTPEGTELVKVLLSSYDGRQLDNLINVNGKLYFVGSAAANTIVYYSTLWSIGTCTPANPFINTLEKTTLFNSQVQDSPNTTCYCNIFNELITTVEATGSAPVNGVISIKEWRSQTIEGYYVPRQYELYPSINPDNATAKITLYYTQNDFNAYNENTASALKLPVDSSDVKGISSIFIEKREGTSFNDSGWPSTYSGGMTQIHPDDTDIAWNSDAKRWEVSFETTGMGGYLLKTLILTDPTSVSVSDTAICSDKTITLQATCASGTLNWYTSATGGSSIGTTSPLMLSPTTTYTYYAACEYGLNSTSRIATSEVKVTLMPTAPTNVNVSNQAVCSGKNITLSANCAIGTITWYNSATGTASIGTGNNLIQTPLENTSYYVTCENGDCKTSKALAGQVNVLETPINPVNLSLGITKMCSGQLNFLTGYCISGNLNWYTSATATIPAATGSYVSIAPTATVRYYAACETSNCSSERIAMDEIVVYTQPIKPTGVAINKTAICKGDTIALSGTCAIGTLRWFRIGVGTDTSFTTTPPTSSTYYAICVNGHCFSDEVATDIVEVTEQPIIPINLYQGGNSLCAGERVYLAATCVIGTPTWYSSASGGTAIASGEYATPQPAITMTYYVACENGNCKSQRIAYEEITVHTQPVNPTGVAVSQTAICNGDSISLSGFCSIGTLRWYKTSMDPDTAFTYRPKMNTIYYAFCNNESCVSEIIATSEVVVTQKPSKPNNVTVSRTTICATETVTLTASCALGTVSWYNSSSATTVLGTGSSFSHSPTANTTYYAACINGICNSERIATTAVLVKVKPEKPVVSANRTTICSGETITLSSSIPANTPTATLRWSSGITSMSTSVNISPTITTGYKTVATFDGCSSDSSTALQITVNRVPAQPSITADNATICRGTSAILIAQCPSTTDSFYWSNSALTNADTPGGVYKSTRAINEPGTYKGWCESNTGCKGPEKSITITAGTNCNGKDFITITPAKPVICPNTSVTLTAAGCSGTITWIGGASSRTGTSINISPTTTTTYIAQCSTGGFGSVDITVVGTAVVINNNITTGSEKIKALNTIESAKKIGDPNFTPAPVVTFEAGKSILLKPGFVADARSVFTAQIKGCN